MPLSNDIDRDHYLRDSSKPRDATEIPLPGMAPLSGISQPGRTKPKPGASHVHRPLNSLRTDSDGTSSTFSAKTSRPYASGAERGQYQSYASKARGSTDSDTSPDLRKRTTTRAPKRQRVEDMHRSQSSPAAPTVDLTRDESPTIPTRRQHTGTVGQHGKPIKAHSIDSDRSTTDIKNRSGFFPMTEYGSLNNRLTYKAPRRHGQASDDTRPALKAVCELSEKKAPRYPPSMDRLMEELSRPTNFDIGTFNPGPRRKSQPEDAQPVTEHGSHRRITQLQESLKRPDVIEEFPGRPARSSKRESDKSLSVSTTLRAKSPMSPHEDRRLALEVFAVRSSCFFSGVDGTLALAYHAERSHYDVVNGDGPIVQATGHLFIDTENILEVSHSSKPPWRVQIIDRRRDRWQRFAFRRQSDHVEFLDYLKETVGIEKLNRKESVVMQNLFNTLHPFESSDPPGLAEEAALLRVRTRERDERPPQREPNHRSDVRRERSAKLVSQMRPETEKTSDEPEPAWEKVSKNDQRLTRLTTRAADDGYPSLHRRVKEKQAALAPRPRKLSEDPGFGPEWPHPVVFPSSGRYQSQVSFSDFKRLEDGEFWNDSVISFCMAWSLDQAKKKNGFDENRIHIFSTYFCTKLWEPPTTNGINYGNVVRWTSKIDLFSRDFVIVPVNDADHWHLAIIVNMKNVGKSLDERKRPDEEGLPSDQTAEGDQFQPHSELKQDLIKTLGAGKSGKLSEQSNGRLNSPAKAAVKKPSGIDPERTSVIVFDSLGATHPKTVRTLKQYIIAEARAKRGLLLTTRDIQAINAKEIPLQPNYYDCGVFVCGYFEKFIQDPDDFVEKIMYKAMDCVADWPDLDPLNMRRDTLLTLRCLQQRQHEERREARKKKREEAGKQKSATPKEGSPEKPSTDSSDGNALPMNCPPKSSSELSMSVREAVPEDREERPLRSSSPRVVVMKEAPTPPTDPPAQGAAAGTCPKAPGQTAGQHLSKRSNDDDVMMFDADRPSKKPRLERNSESPTKNSKSPQPQFQGPKKTPKAEPHSAAEVSREEPAEIDRSVVPERPSSKRRARELRTEVPESPPGVHTQSVVCPDERKPSLHDGRSLHTHSKLRRVRRTPAQLKDLFDDDDVIEVHRTPPQPECESDDDEVIEDPSEVDLVRHPQYQDDHQRQWQSEGGTPDVYGDSEMQESQQVEDPEDWRADLMQAIDERGSKSKKMRWSPPPDDYRSKYYRPNVHGSEDHRLDDRNGPQQHEVISLTDDDN